MVDLGTAQEEGEPNMPFCLQAGAEDSDAVDALTLVEDRGCGQGCAEGGKGCGGKEGVGCAVWSEELEGAVW